MTTDKDKLLENFLTKYPSDVYIYLGVRHSSNFIMQGTVGEIRKDISNIAEKKVVETYGYGKGKVVIIEAQELIDKLPTTDFGIDRLREAIIKQAVKDYTRPIKVDFWQFKKIPANEVEKDIEKQVERFFRSEWYKYLCDIDGEEMIKMCRRKKAKRKKGGYYNGIFKD